MATSKQDRLKQLVALPELQILTVCKMAQRDLAQGKIEDAIARLRVDGDKIRPMCRELYDLISIDK